MNKKLEQLIESIILQEIADYSSVPRKFSGIVAFVNAYNDIRFLLDDAPIIELEYLNDWSGKLNYNNGKLTFGKYTDPDGMFDYFGHDIIHAITVNLAKQFTSPKNLLGKQSKSLLLKNIELIGKNNNIDILKHLGFKGHNFQVGDFIATLLNSDLPTAIKNDPRFLITKTRYQKAIMPGENPSHYSDGDLPQHMAEEIFGNAILAIFSPHIKMSTLIPQNALYKINDEVRYLISHSFNDYEASTRTNIEKLSNKFVGYSGTKSNPGLETLKDSPLLNLINRFNFRLNMLKKVKFEPDQPKKSPYDWMEENVQINNSNSKIDLLEKLIFRHQSSEYHKILHPISYEEISIQRKNKEYIKDRFENEKIYHELLNDKSDSSKSFLYATIVGFHKMDSPESFPGYTYYFKLSPEQVEKTLFTIVHENNSPTPVNGFSGLIQALKIWKNNKDNFKSVEDDLIGQIDPRIEVIINYSVEWFDYMPQEEDRKDNEKEKS